jgi:hypothetical protein
VATAQGAFKYLNVICITMDIFVEMKIVPHEAREGSSLVKCDSEHVCKNYRLPKDPSIAHAQSFGMISATTFQVRVRVDTPAGKGLYYAHVENHRLRSPWQAGRPLNKMRY